MNFLVKEINGIYAVWLTELNRYILLKEPAFVVFSIWARNKMDTESIKEFSDRYNLPENETKRFVEEVLEQIRTLTENYRGTKEHSAQSEVPVKFNIAPVKKRYQINGLTILIIYGNSYIEEQIHCRLQHLSVNKKVKSFDYKFTLTFSEGKFFLETGNGLRRSFELVEELAGGLYLQLLHLIHGIPPDSWMGVAHASAVTDGQEAVLFMARSGGGKSTIASLMVANGFKILSDDFVPIAITEPEIYYFPAGISVKETAIPFLKDFFPEIEDIDVTARPGYNKNGVYLPFPPGSLNTRAARTRAVVFVQYDESVQCELRKRKNHELMDRFVSETWIANNAKAARRFLDWYFDLRVYTLRYSDSKKAVGSIKKIFKD